MDTEEDSNTGDVFKFKQHLIRNLYLIICQIQLFIKEKKMKKDLGWNLDKMSQLGNTFHKQFWKYGTGLIST